MGVLPGASLGASVQEHQDSGPGLPRLLGGWGLASGPKPCSRLFCKEGQDPVAASPAHGWGRVRASRGQIVSHTDGQPLPGHLPCDTVASVGPSR